METPREQTAFPPTIMSFRNHDFVEINKGLLIVPNIAYEHQGEVRAIQESLFRLKQEVLVASGRSDVGAMCIACEDNNSDGVFLFPICREAHHFVCLGCLKDEAERGTERIVCPYDREDPFAMTEYRRIISERREAFRNQQEELLNHLAVQLPHAPSDFLLSTTNIPDNPSLLTEKTTVSLENIAISEFFFFVLLSKTKVRVGENLSLFGDNNGEDCIAEHGMARTDEPCCIDTTNVFWMKKPTPLFLENINSIPLNSIVCTLGYHLWCKDGFVNILLKLRIGENSKTKFICLHAAEKRYITEILEQENNLFLGKTEEMELHEYAVLVFLKLSEATKNSILFLRITVTRAFSGLGELSERIIPLCAANDLYLTGYALDLLPEPTTRENVFLKAETKHEIAGMLTSDRRIEIGTTTNISLENYAVNILPKLKMNEGIKSLLLKVDREDYVKEILETADNSIEIGRIESITLYDQCIDILPKLKIGRNNEMKTFYLLPADYNNITTPILEKGDNSIEIGRVKRSGFCVPEEINPKLKYILVDEKGNEVIHLD
ncbi:MAG: uncharacterized protein A8A55_1860 [Amphiamblys sp. WSBS2006]|nr:MAG: uncharacterized protein A8A55_1860 [Amphiamblys sp. WSBS2006]